MHGKYYKEVQELIPILKDTAQREILSRFGKVEEERKRKTTSGYLDSVTEADKEASKRILNLIRKKFPGSYSEEHLYKDRFNYDLVWQFDPLDGTREFCELIEDGYAMNAALLKRQADEKYSPIAGIIYMPGVDKLLFNDGLNTKLIKKGRSIKIQNPTRDKIKAWVRKVDPSKKLINFHKHLGKKLNLPFLLVLRGGLGASIIDLVEGRINLLVYNYNISREWDWAMAEPIIRNFGGFISDLSGKEFDNYNRMETHDKSQYNLNGVIASIVFKKEEIIPYIPNDLLENRL